MGEADTMESKRRIDNTLNSIIEQSGDRVRTPFWSFCMAVIIWTSDSTFHKRYHSAFTATMCVAFYLSTIDSNHHLGTSAGEDWLFKGSLLVTITRLIEVRKPGL